MSTVWRDSEGRSWLVQVQFAPVGARYECVGVEIRAYRGDTKLRGMPEKPSGPMPALLLRRVPIGRIVAELRGHMIRRLAEDTVVFLEDSETPPSLADEARQRQLWASSPRGGPRLPSEHYREVAQVYRDAWTSGTAPTQAVARHFRVSSSGAAKQVQKARALGFLPHAPKPGQAGIGAGRTS